MTETDKEVLRLLTDIGEMSMAEMVRLTGLKHMRVQKAVRVLRDAGHMYIQRYERQPDGVKGRCTPIYVAGIGEDAKPLPRLSRKTVCKRYRERHAAIISTRRYTKQREQLGVWSGLGAQ